MPHLGGRGKSDPAPDAALKLKKVKVGIKLILDPELKKEEVKEFERLNREGPLNRTLCVIAEHSRAKSRISKLLMKKYPHLFFVLYHQLFDKKLTAPVRGKDFGRTKTLLQLFHYFEITGGLKN